MAKKKDIDRTWSGWVCPLCALKKGLVYPKGHVSSCVLATCPECGMKTDLTPVTDYKDPSKGGDYGKKEG